MMQAQVAAADVSAKDFLGPLPGVRYFYEGPGGGKMELRGLAWEQDGTLLLEELNIFPIVPKPESLCVNLLTGFYGLSIANNCLLKKGFPLNGERGFSTLLDFEKKVWGNPFRRGDGPLMKSQCRVLSRTQQHLFGKTRTVIEVGGDYCPPSKYASGIGMIEFIGFHLVNIEVKGTPVAVY